MAHWVQIELPPNGDNTQATQLDLEKINRLQFIWKGDKLSHVIFNYGAEPGPSVLDFSAAESFYEKWEAFNGQNVLIRDERAVPGIIQVSSNITPFKK